ncbi:hypothetical protein AB1E18_009286 [Capra hircus]
MQGPAPGVWATKLFRTLSLGARRRQERGRDQRVVGPGPRPTSAPRPQPPLRHRPGAHGRPAAGPSQRRPRPPPAREAPGPASRPGPGAPYLTRQGPPGTLARPRQRRQKRARMVFPSAPKPTPSRQRRRESAGAGARGGSPEGRGRLGAGPPVGRGQAGRGLRAFLEHLAHLTHLEFRAPPRPHLVPGAGGALAPSVRLEGLPRPALVSGFRGPGPAVLCPQHPRARGKTVTAAPCASRDPAGKRRLPRGPGEVHSAMASLGDLLRDWHQGAQAVARGDWDCALRLFSSVSEPPARVSFNVGCVHLLAGDPEAALRAFDRAVTKDACLAVGFLQRGVANFQLERFQEALSDFQRTLAQLRDNTAIDYTQLGLRFKLQAWEVLFNVAAVQSQLGLWAEATCSLGDAISKGPEGVRNDLDIALGQVQKQVPLQPRQVPRGEVFRPHRRHMEHLEPVDFLGKAKVLASALPAGSRGVTPPQPQALDVRGEARPRAAARARDTAPGRADTPCSPRTPADVELEVSSGQAGQHNHGTLVTHKSAHGEDAGQQAPPGLLAAGEPSPGSSEEPTGAGGAAPGDPESLATVTVQCVLTLSLTAPRGADLSRLRALMSEALPPHAQRAQLSYQDPSEDGRWVPLSGEEALRRAWRDAAGPGGLHLQCRGVGGRPVLYQVVAQHVYSAQRPEDLALQPGDTVDVLCEVDQAWLEGHCDGRTGIFPKSFTVPAARRA